MRHRGRAGAAPGSAAARRRRRALRGGDGPPRPRRPRVLLRRSDRARAPAPVDHRSLRGRPPADDQRGRTDRHRRQRRDLQPRRAARRPRRQGTSVSQRQRLGGGGPPLRGGGGARAGAPARDVRLRAVGRAPVDVAPGARSLRRKAALLRRAAGRLRVRLRARRVARRRADPGQPLAAGAGRLSGAAVRPQPRHHLRGAEEAPRRAHAGAPLRRAAGGASLLSPQLRADAGRARRAGGGGARARHGREGGAGPAHVGRAAGRVSFGRRRLVDRRRLHGARDGLAGQDVLHRLLGRGARGQRAAVRAPGRRALPHRSPRADRRARHDRAAPVHRAPPRRAVRRQLGGPDLLSVPAGAAST